MNQLTIKTTSFIKKSLYFLHLFIFSHICLAQQYDFRVYSLEQGLPQSEIWHAIQDSRNNLWLGTNGGGLCRFNGKEFEVFTKEDGLVDNQVNQLFEDREGNIWASTFRGISVYNGKTFRNFTVEDDKIMEAGFARIFEDSVGNVHIMKRQDAQHVQMLAFRNGEIVPSSEPSEKTLENRPNIFNFFQLEDNRILAISPQVGWAEISDGKLKPIELPFSQQIANNIVIPVFNDKQGGTWAVNFGQGGTGAGSLQRFQGNDIETIQTPQPILLGGGGPHQIFKDSRGILWVAVVGGGVMRYNGKEFDVFNENNGFPKAIVSHIFEDHENNIWFTTRGSGLVRYSGERFLTFDQRDGFKSEIARTIFQDSKSHFWFGLSGEIAKYDGNSLKHYLQGFPNLGQVNKFIELENGNLLLATFNRGLLEFDGKKAVNVNRKYGLPQGVRNVADMLHENDNFWFAGGGGVIKSTPEGSKRYNRQNGLAGNIVMSLNLDSDGSIWACTTLGVTHIVGETLTSYTVENGLKNNLTMQKTEDLNGNRWFATYGGGISRFSGDQFVSFSKEDGLTTNIIYSIMTDNDGNLWLGTQNGIDKIELDESSNIKSVKNYNREDGFLGVETNGKANFKDSNGNLWFGTIKGAIRYNPKEDSFEDPLLNTQITNVRLFFNDIDWKASAYNSFFSTLSNWFSLPEQLVLPADSNHVSFDFEAISFRSSEKVRYQWKLEGLDKTWSPVSEANSAVYPGLKPGNYTFKTRARNGEGVWNNEPTIFQFTVSPPFWQTLPFIIISSLLGIVVLIGTFRWRTHAIKSQNKKLERLVNEKTAEVTEQRDEILQINEELKQQQEEVLTRNEQINTQNIELNKKNRDITSSINYAKRIQDAMLPQVENMRKNFPDLFVFFKPRDIVSGDFYWHSKVGDKLFIAVVDCTGHGVPGAFMSMTGDALLNQIVNIEKITDPAQILQSLHKAIRRALKQEKTNNRDGMDMSICMIDKVENTLTFAGAKSAMIYIQNGELKKLKGDRVPIGGLQLETERIFTNKIIPLETLTYCYLFSDGYVDQFGGAAGRKFMMKALKKLLLDIHTKPLKEQENIIEDTISRWMKYDNGYSQIDDILVIGFSTENI